MYQNNTVTLTFDGQPNDKQKKCTSEIKSQEGCGLDESAALTDHETTTASQYIQRANEIDISSLNIHEI